MSLRIQGPRMDEAPALLGREDRVDLVRDRPRHLSLKAKDVAQGPLIVLGPEVAVGRAVDQLDGDSNVVFAAHHRALDDRVNAELSCDLGQRRARFLVQHHRGSRDDIERGDLCELADQCLGHTVREVLLLRVAREILKGQHRDRADRAHIRSARESTPETRKREYDDQGTHDGDQDGDDVRPVAADRRPFLVWRCVG